MSGSHEYLPGLFVRPQLSEEARGRSAEAEGQAFLRRSHTKISIVGGGGAVGLACAYSILNQGVCSELALIDVAKEKVEGEVMDLQHGSAFCKQTTIIGGTEYSLCQDSNLVIITAGVRQRLGESRRDLVQRNVDIFKGMIPEIVKYAPHTCIMVVSNPCDIMTWVTWKLSKLPWNRVFGSGTALDSSRFRTLVSKRLGVASSSVHGYILGEHGDSSVPAWSQLTIGGVSLKTLNNSMGDPQSDSEDWESVYKSVVSAAEDVISRKGYTNWAIGLTVAYISTAILRNENRIIPVSTVVQGLYGVDKEVYLSVPAVVGAGGIHEVVQMHLNDDELRKLHESASVLHDIQNTLSI